MKNLTVFFAAILALLLCAPVFSDEKAKVPFNELPKKAQDEFAVAAFRGVLEKAKAGNPDAQSSVANWYHAGQGTPQNLVEAAKWHRKAAEQGNAFSQEALGTFYLGGLGVSKDFTMANKWYRKAAEQGRVKAQYV